MATTKSRVKGEAMLLARSSREGWKKEGCSACCQCARWPGCCIWGRMMAAQTVWQPTIPLKVVAYESRYSSESLGAHERP